VTRGEVLVWLSNRRPERPDALILKMLLSVKGCPAASLERATTMAEAMGVLGMSALKAVTAEGTAGPELALELLAADAFVTYAFEAAAEEGVSVGPLVDRLLHEAA
jgi:hypothetical protein